jgi:Spy/CpxP family protein refolding chaperone
MKRMIIGLSLVALLVVGAGSVLARGFGPGDCPFNGQGWGNTAGMQENQRQFLEESLKLRQEMATQKIELRTLLAGENPDQARVQELRDSLGAKREQLGQIAAKHNVELGNGRGHGPRHGRGWRMQQAN